MPPVSASPEGIILSKNGLVEAAVHAWNHHNDLVLRPDDFWSAILSQLNFYTNMHAERRRNIFLSVTRGRRPLKLARLLPSSLPITPYLPT